MNTITLHDNATGTEHLTTTVSNKCLENLQELETHAGFKRFSLDIHSIDAPKKQTQYTVVAKWLKNNVFYEAEIHTLKKILKS